MPSEELQDATAGAVKGSLSWGEEKIKSLVRKFINRELQFIQDDDTINLVKQQLKSGEWSLFSQYVKDHDLKLLVQMGLTLRKLDADKELKALQNLRDKIVWRYRKKGLHIAQFVQSKILNEFIGSVADKAGSVSELIENVENLLNNLENYTLFVQKTDAFDNKLEEIKIKLTAMPPDFFIIFTSKSAITLGLTIVKDINNYTNSYVF